MSVTHQEKNKIFFQSVRMREKTPRPGNSPDFRPWNNIGKKPPFR